MSKISVRIFIILLVFAAPGVILAGGKSDEADRESLTQLLDNYSRFLEAGDFEAWGNLHAEDVVKMPPDAPAATSREEMVKGTAMTGTMFHFTGFDVSIEEIIIRGNYAQAWGNYKMALVSKGDGPTIPVDGKYLTLFEKMDDGSWIITHDCFNSNVPPPMP